MTSRHPLRLFVALLAVAAFALAGCGDDDSGGGGSGGDGGGDDSSAVETIEADTLTVCSDVPYEPFEFEGDGPSGYTGFDIELLAAIAETADLEVVVTDVDFDGINGNLEAGNCDVIGSAYTINPEREEEVDFTDPYFDAEQSLLVAADSDVTKLDDLAGSSIGVQSGTTGETYANENTPEGAEIRAFDGADSLFAAFDAGEVDAILQDFPVNAYRATQNEDVEVVEEYPTEEQYGFAVKKDNSALLGVLNDGLAEVREAGDYDTLYEKYFGTAPGE